MPTGSSTGSRDCHLRPRLIASLAMLLALFTAGIPAADAHEVTLADGTTLEGEVTEQTDAEVVIETTFDGTKRVPRVQVLKVDLVPKPLRQQLRERADASKDSVRDLWKFHRWAKKAGFEKELELILQRIVELSPKNSKARKLLGHIKTEDGRWMSPAELEAERLAKEEAEMKAKGLVRYQGKWVTPEDKEAMERGLMKDGDAWVTEEQYYTRRGMRKVGGEWVKVGEKEGDAYLRQIISNTRLGLKYTWSPACDVYSEMGDEVDQRVAENVGKAMRIFLGLMNATSEDYPQGAKHRLRLVLFKKQPGYRKFAGWFEKDAKVTALIDNWANQVIRMKSWWWVQPTPTVSAYRFPDTDKTFVSNVVHNAAMMFLTKYKFNGKMPAVWLREGLAYYLEMEAMGYSLSFSLGKGGTASQGTEGPSWADSAQWKTLLAKDVTANVDVPLRRLVKYPFSNFGFQELVKSWSVIDYLARLDPKKFKDFIDRSKRRDKTEQLPGELALKGAYGMTYGELDKHWRKYATNGFRIN